MDLIKRHSFEFFQQYTHLTKYTICGRHSIQILLAMIELAYISEDIRGPQSKYETEFV